MSDDKITESSVPPAYLAAALAYALYERRMETDLRNAFVKLVIERHERFHNAGVGYEGCKNEICADACRVIEAGRDARLVITNFGLELTAGFVTTFRAERDSSGEKVERVVVQLVERGKIERPPLIAVVGG